MVHREQRCQDRGITTAGSISEFPIPNSLPSAIARGPDNALWFTDGRNNSIGRIGLPSYTLSVAATPPTGGTVTGGGTFVAVTSPTVTATASSGHRFVNWTQGGNVVSTSPNYTFTLAGNFALVANFTQSNTHDFNVDGMSDIAWRDTANNIAIWLMNGNQLSQGGGIGAVPSIWSIVGQRDFDGDGKADLLWNDSPVMSPSGS